MHDHRLVHHEGPGLKELSPGERWYGSGYCGVCGDVATDAPTCAVVARAVRYWDVDDGWRVGILCVHCAGMVLRHGGPQPEDYASRTATDDAALLDVLALDGDLDALNIGLAG